MEVKLMPFKNKLINVSKITTYNYPYLGLKFYGTARIKLNSKSIGKQTRTWNISKNYYTYKYDIQINPKWHLQPTCKNYFKDKGKRSNESECMIYRKRQCFDLSSIISKTIPKSERTLKESRYLKRTNGVKW